MPREFDPMDASYVSSNNIDLIRRPPNPNNIAQPQPNARNKSIDYKRAEEQRNPSANHTLKRRIPTVPTEAVLDVEQGKREAKLTREQLEQITHGSDISYHEHNLKGYDKSNFAPVQDIKKYTPPPKENSFEKTLFDNLDAAVNRDINSISERMKGLEERMFEDYMDITDNEEINQSNNSSLENRQYQYDNDDTEEYDSSNDEYYENDEQNIPSNIITNNEEYDEENLPFTMNDYDVSASNSSNPTIKTLEEFKEMENNSNHSENITVDDDTIPDEEDIKPNEKIVIKKEVEMDGDESWFKNANDDTDEEIENIEKNEAKSEEQDQKELEDIAKNLSKEAKKVIKPLKSIDLSLFKIANKGVKYSTLAINEEEVKPHSADWVLVDAKVPITMRALSGPELIKLDPGNSNRNRANTLNDIYHILYDHVEDINKPSYEVWMKQTRYSDLDHIYFAEHIATFGESNFVSYQCPKCGKVFIKTIDIMDMVNYKDDNAKNMIEEIRSKPTDNGVIPYNVERHQVSEKYVFDVKNPSLYNIVIENAGLPNRIIDKYSDLIDTISYIDKVYTIDYMNMSLVPVIIPKVKNDPVATAVKKIKSMYTILRTLSSDEYYNLRGIVTALSESSEAVTYKLPGAICPECDEEVPENSNVSAEELLFTRHRLGAFASISLT